MPKFRTLTGTCRPFSVRGRHRQPRSLLEEDLGYPQILKKNEYMDEPTYNILNNYLNGLMRCDRALGWLADSVMEMEEPVVLIYFSDHLPWLGENDSGYRALGFKTDADGSLQEYLNKYETPYFILINGSAEKLLLENGITVKKGQGPQISVNYLAVELLEAVGINGGNYFNYLSELRKEVPVITSRFIKEKDRFTENLRRRRRNCSGYTARSSTIC